MENDKLKFKNEFLTLKGKNNFYIFNCHFNF